MKFLTLVRHAKSSWKHDGLKDFDRPLNKRGKQDLPLLCERLIQYQLFPDQLIFSPATRTRLTAARIIERLAIPLPHCQDHPEIYESSTETLLQVIQQVTNQTNHLMLVGHNPGLQDLGNYLLEGRSSVPHFPTSAVLHLGLNIEKWSDLHRGCANCIRLDYPKLHSQHPFNDTHPDD